LCCRCAAFTANILRKEGFTKHFAASKQLVSTPRPMQMLELEATAEKDFTALLTL
jgi:hypothetical protein